MTFSARNANAGQQLEAADRRSSSPTLSAVSSSTPSLPSPASPLVSPATTTPLGTAAASLVPAQWMTSVRMIGKAESREVALSLAMAFADDDVSRYLVGSDGTAGLSADARWLLHVDIMAYNVSAVTLRGSVAAIGGPDCDAVALWLPPRKLFDDWWTILRSGLWRLHFQLSPECRRRYYVEVLPLLHQTKLEIMGARNDCCYYLLYLGVKPSARRRGYGQKLLEALFNRADIENCPIYLESSSTANNAYYYKFGFEVKRVISLVRGTEPVHLSVMIREPRPPAAAKTQTSECN